MPVKQGRVRGNKNIFKVGLDFFWKYIFKWIIQKCHQSVKKFGCISDPTNVGPDLDPNFLQRLSADDNSSHQQRELNNWI